jgi:hypothetical protein
MQPPERLQELLLHVADKVDAHDLTGGILDRLIARDVGLAQDARARPNASTWAIFREQRPRFGLVGGKDPASWFILVRRLLAPTSGRKRTDSR